jgi:hypothetical protein
VRKEGLVFQVFYEFVESVRGPVIASIYEPGKAEKESKGSGDIPKPCMCRHLRYFSSHELQCYGHYGNEQDKTEIHTHFLGEDKPPPVLCMAGKDLSVIIFADPERTHSKQRPHGQRRQYDEDDSRNGGAGLQIETIVGIEIKNDPS